ncbi:hypothetical protein PCE1_004143 [Barthelona sp. PCE]
MGKNRTTRDTLRMLAPSTIDDMSRILPARLCDLITKYNRSIDKVEAHDKIEVVIIPSDLNTADLVLRLGIVSKSTAVALGASGRTSDFPKNLNILSDLDGLTHSEKKMRASVRLKASKKTQIRKLMKFMHDRLSIKQANTSLLQLMSISDVFPLRFCISQGDTGPFYTLNDDSNFSILHLWIMSGCSSKLTLKYTFEHFLRGFNIAEELDRSANASMGFFEALECLLKSDIVSTKAEQATSTQRKRRKKRKASDLFDTMAKIEDFPQKSQSLLEFTPLSPRSPRTPKSPIDPSYTEGTSIKKLTSPKSESETTDTARDEIFSPFSLFTTGNFQSPLLE